MRVTSFSLARYSASGLIGLHFTPEELFIGFGNRRGRSFNLRSLACIDIRPHVLEGGEYNYVTLVPVVHNAIKEHNIATRRAVVSFPVKFPWIRVLDVPAMAEKDMARVVRLEVERLYLDSTVDKLIDYFPLETIQSPDGGGLSTKVLSVAIPRNTVAPYVELLAACRLELVGIDLAEVNVLKLASLQGVDFGTGISLLLNFNMQSTDLMLMERGTLQLVRKIGQGKQQLREALTRNLPSESSSRQTLQSVEFVLPPEEIQYASGFVAQLLSEIRRSIEFYLTELKRAEGNVTKVVLAGSGYWPANLSQVLSQQLNLPLIDLRMEQIPNVICETAFTPGFPACGVYAPVIGSVLRGAA